MKTIGILGGLGPESTISYYSYITRRYHELRGDLGYPEIIIHSFSFADILESGYKLPGKIKAAIEGLHQCGADFAIAACNSVHAVYDQLRDDLPIPWLSIMDAVGEEVQRAGVAKVAILGTVYTMTGEFYAPALAEYGVEVIAPCEADQQVVNKIIYDELVTARVTDESRAAVLEIIDRLRAEGAQGVILGCTELPFLIKQKHTDVQVFDSTEIHARKALAYAMA